MEVVHLFFLFFFFQAEDGIRDLVRSRGLGDVYKRQALLCATDTIPLTYVWYNNGDTVPNVNGPCVPTDSTGLWWGVATNAFGLSLIHI